MRREVPPLKILSFAQSLHWRIRLRSTRSLLMAPTMNFPLSCCFAHQSPMSFPISSSFCQVWILAVPHSKFQWCTPLKILSSQSYQLVQPPSFQLFSEVLEQSAPCLFLVYFWLFERFIQISELRLFKASAFSGESKLRSKLFWNYLPKNP